MPKQFFKYRFGNLRKVGTPNLMVERFFFFKVRIWTPLTWWTLIPFPEPPGCLSRTIVVRTGPSALGTGHLVPRRGRGRSKVSGFRHCALQIFSGHREPQIKAPVCQIRTTMDVAIRIGLYLVGLRKNMTWGRRSGEYEQYR